MIRILLFSLLVVSCSSKPTSFCTCLESGNALNEFSATLFQKDLSSEDESKMVALRDQKKKDCKDYENMGGAEMMKLKAECEE